MKATGIVRRVDRMGRIVLPVELRAQLGIGQGTPVEIYRDGEVLVLVRLHEACIFCGSSGSLQGHDGKMVCQKCAAEIARASGFDLWSASSSGI